MAGRQARRMRGRYLLRFVWANPVGRGLAPPLLSGFFLGMRRGFRPAGRVSFPAMGKKPKDRRGTAQDGHFVSIFAFPPDPRYGGYPLQWAEHFRRAKSGVLGGGPVRPHWGPEREKNGSCCGPTSAPEFAEPTLPVCFLCRGAPRGRPKAFPFRGRCRAKRGG